MGFSRDAESAPQYMMGRSMRTNVSSCLTPQISVEQCVADVEDAVSTNADDRSYHHILRHIGAATEEQANALRAFITDRRYESPCFSHVDCSSCMANKRCSWCSSSRRCEEVDNARCPSRPTRSCDALSTTDSQAAAQRWRYMWKDS